MNPVEEPGFGNAPVVVLDAGVPLAQRHPRHRAHTRAKELLERGRRGRARLVMSVVNLAETLQHSRAYERETGVDVVALLRSFGVSFERPDVAVARRVAELADLPEASLGDRFAAATAPAHRGRLVTTDSSLAAALRRRGFPVTWI